MRYALILMVFLVTANAPAVADRDRRSGRIDDCRKVVASIEQYQAKRRRGGSIRKMEDWKRQIRAQQDRYSELDCKRLRRHL